MMTDTTMQNALKIISNPEIMPWRKAYWINFIKDEIAGLFTAGLESSARDLKNQLNAVTSSKVQ